MKHLLSLIDKEISRVADIGCGPHALTSCTFANGTKITFYPIDQRHYTGVIKGDMESLDYPKDFFDGVQCINALDHTLHARQAIEEMIRIAKHWVYIDCALDQLTTSGGHHYWDAKEDGTLVNTDETIRLKDYGFKIEYINSGGERRYNHIIARLKK